MTQQKVTKTNLLSNISYNTGQQILTFFVSEKTLTGFYRSWRAENGGVLRIFVSRKVFEKTGMKDFNWNACLLPIIFNIL